MAHQYGTRVHYCTVYSQKDFKLLMKHKKVPKLLLESIERIGLELKKKSEYNTRPAKDEWANSSANRQKSIRFLIDLI